MADKTPSIGDRLKAIEERLDTIEAAMAVLGTAIEAWRRLAAKTNPDLRR